MCRYYSLERMFAIQLLNSAKDELAYRTVVREIQSNHPMLQIVLLNPDSWCYSGCCLNSMEPASQRSMYPTIKVLFSACGNDKENESRSVLQMHLIYCGYQVIVCPLFDIRYMSLNWSSVDNNSSLELILTPWNVLLNL